MLIPAGSLIIFIVSALLCSPGFKKFIYFISIGYGLSVAGIGATLGIMSIVRGQFSAPYLIESLLFLIYGIRLSGFLLFREIKNASYRKTLSEATGGDKKTPIFVSVFVWIFSAILYMLQTSPAIYRLANGMTAGDAALYIGLAISIVGLALEALADKQKSAQKAVRPDMAATKGLYKFCRCPNYFGEIVFWTGVFVSGISILTGLQWLIAVIGYIAIFFIMVSGAKRLETRQLKNYGDKAEYREYADKTPILFPFIPIYHLVKEDKKESE